MNFHTLIPLITKYIILFIIIFVFIKFIPNTNSSSKDDIILSMFLIMLFIIYELVKKIIFEGMENTNQTNNENANNTNQETSTKEEIPEVLETSNPDIYKNNSSQNTEITDVNVENTKLEKAKNENTLEKTEFDKKFNTEKNPLYKSNDDIITDETIYDSYGNFINSNQLFVPNEYKTSDEDYGFTFVRSEDWFKTNPKNSPVPLCIPSSGRCKICPTQTTGYPVDLKTWHRSRRVMNPDGINVKYVEDKLNSGR
jgi:hypothetical protein